MVEYQHVLLGNCRQGFMAVPFWCVKQWNSVHLRARHGCFSSNCRPASWNDTSALAAERLWPAVQVLSTAQGRRFKASLFTLPRIWAQIQARLSAELLRYTHRLYSHSPRLQRFRAYG